jgi:hypothetical protein
MQRVQRSRRPGRAPGVACQGANRTGLSRLRSAVRDEAIAEHLGIQKLTYNGGRTDVSGIPALAICHRGITYFLWQLRQAAAKVSRAGT